MLSARSTSTYPILASCSSNWRAIRSATADWLTQAATGFLVGGTHDIVGNQTIEGMLQQRADDLDDMITATGTTFLGLTVQCARCHDHKFDPISQKDYYSLQAVFAGVEHAEREVLAPDVLERQREARAVLAELATIDQQLDEHEPFAQPGRDKPGRAMVNARRNVERFAPVRARMVRLTILATNDRTEPCIDEIEVYTAATEADKTRAKPTNVALATAGGVASASSEYPNSSDPQDRSLERRPGSATAGAGSRACRARGASRSPGGSPP